MVGIIEKNLKRDYVKDMSQYYDENKMNELNRKIYVMENLIGHPNKNVWTYPTFFTSSS